METPFCHYLRAASIVSQRARTRAEKFSNFRYVKPGQLHQPHYVLLDLRDRVHYAEAGLMPLLSTLILPLSSLLLLGCCMKKRNAGRVQLDIMTDMWMN